MEEKKTTLTFCPKCYGQGKKNVKLRKDSKIRYEIALKKFQENKDGINPTISPKITQYLCEGCLGSGLTETSIAQLADLKKHPHVAIIGAGISGVALAVACLHRNISFTLYERDKSFDARAQGYGLTLQQASNAIKGFGIFSLKDGIYSKRHVVHTTDGNEIIEWGMKTHQKVGKSPKRINVIIPRQSLRLALLEQLGQSSSIKWGHRLIDYKECEDKSLNLTFEANKQIIHTKADLVVGSDGINSTFANLIFGNDLPPLNYMGFIVILGICPLKNLKEVKSSLLDSATVFQTINGHERIYMMPYTLDSIMWQFSFPLSEKEAKELSAKGSEGLKNEALKRANWHAPIPQILYNTDLSQITGYPLYDRSLYKKKLFDQKGAVTLIGDAAHPMSPFKGQGANQALLDALCLARKISMKCRLHSNWKEINLREDILLEFEEEMLERSYLKIKDSAKAAEILHSKQVLSVRDEPNGRLFKL